MAIWQNWQTVEILVSRPDTKKKSSQDLGFHEADEEKLLRHKKQGENMVKWRGSDMEIPSIETLSKDMRICNGSIERICRRETAAKKHRNEHIREEKINDW